VIVFRNADPRFPFLWEDGGRQPAARWHDHGEGPAQYLAETADGAWAEFIRHEEITDPDDLDTVRRGLWAIELPDPPGTRPRLPKAAMTGGLDSYERCRVEARRLRARGASALRAPSAALLPRTASGWTVNRGLQPGPRRDESVFVLFGPRPELVGWAACAPGRPRADLLPRVRRLT
jgi:hypothetical protein